MRRKTGTVGETWESPSLCSGHKLADDDDHRGDDCSINGDHNDGDDDNA